VVCSLIPPMPSAALKKIRRAWRSGDIPRVKTSHGNRKAKFPVSSLFSRSIRLENHASMPPHRCWCGVN